MPLEVFTFISSLVRTNPTGTDGVNRGDDHIRGVKQAVQDSFPAVDAACTFTPTEINSWEARLLALELTDLTGAVQAFAATPDGVDVSWLLCDGSEVLRADFVALFTKIADRYGDGDATTTFNLPDYRGEFMRGQDLGKGSDPDAGSRTDRGDGTGGDVIGSKQGSAILAHDHAIRVRQGGIGNAIAPGVERQQQDAQNTDTQAIDEAGGDESRPRNVNVRWYIHV